MPSKRPEDVLPFALLNRSLSVVSKWEATAL